MTMTNEAAALILWLLACDDPFVTPRGLVEALLGGTLATGAEPWAPASWHPPAGPGWQLAARAEGGGPEGPFAAPPPSWPPAAWCVAW